jgi:hypothetical protein
MNFLMNLGLDKETALDENPGLQMFAPKPGDPKPNWYAENLTVIGAELGV